MGAARAIGVMQSAEPGLRPGKRLGDTVGGKPPDY